MKQVVRVNREEFELNDGSIFPIEPPLDYEPNVEEFQEHYTRACELAQSIKNARGDIKNTEKLGL